MNATTELVRAASTVADLAETYIRRSDGWVNAGERLCVELPKLREAIAAARGGAALVTSHQYSHAEVGKLIAVAEAAQAEIDKLRDALRGIATEFDYGEFMHGLDCQETFGPKCICSIAKIRAIVERAVGGAS